MTPNEDGLIISEKLVELDSITLESLGMFDSITIDYKEGTLLEGITIDGYDIDLDDKPRELFNIVNSTTINFSSIVREFEIKFTSTNDVKFIEVLLDTYKVKLLTSRVGYTNTYTTGIVEINNYVNTLSIITTVTSPSTYIYGLEKKKL